MPTSQRWPKPSGPREIGNATGVAAGAGVPEGRLKAVGVTVSVGGWGVAASVGGAVGDGVLSDSTEASTVSVASLSGEPLVGVVSRGGVGERVTVATFVAVAVLVGEDEGVGRGEIDAERSGVMFEYQLVRSRVEQDTVPSELDQSGESTSRSKIFPCCPIIVDDQDPSHSYPPLNV